MNPSYSRTVKRLSSFLQLTKKFNLDIVCENCKRKVEDHSEDELISCFYKIFGKITIQDIERWEQFKCIFIISNNKENSRWESRNEYKESI